MRDFVPAGRRIDYFPIPNSKCAVLHIPVISLLQNGPPARRSEPDWRKEGASAAADVTDEQSRQPIFNATRRDAAGWRFFCVARSAGMNPDTGASLAPRKTANWPAATSPVYARRHTGSFIEFYGPQWNRDKELPSGPLVRW